MDKCHQIITEIHKEHCETEVYKYLSDYLVKQLDASKPKEDEEERNMRVCQRCLAAIESREGNVPTLKHYVDEDDDEASKCEWCDQFGFDVLYELI